MSYDIKKLPFDYSKLEIEGIGKSFMVLGQKFSDVSEKKVIDYDLLF